ncbi:WD40 repeat-like-containing domain protein [Sarocladium implicatum]|nr:WD40 repeat-like-containing domain protein [Sarocladium implicatum]
MAAADELDQVVTGLRRMNSNISYSAFPKPPKTPSGPAATNITSSPRPHPSTRSPHTYHQQTSSSRPAALRAHTAHLPPSPVGLDSSPTSFPSSRIDALKSFPRVEDNELFIMYQSNEDGLNRDFQQRPATRQRQLSSPRNPAMSPTISDEQRPKTAASRRRTSNTSSNVSLTSPAYPPPTKPLPPLPGSARNSNRISSNGSVDEQIPTSVDFFRFSQSSSSGQASLSDNVSINSNPSARHYQHSHQAAAAVPRPREPEPETRRTSVAQHSSVSGDRASAVSSANSVTLRPSRLLDGGTAQAKKKNNAGNTVYYLDLSPNGTTLASKHGNNLVKFWSVEDGTVHATIKFSSYTDAHSRSRDYLIRSHAILSEGSSLAAIAVKFGRTVEIWNWTAKKCLQSLDGADRWAAGRFEFTENAWSQIAVYQNQGEVVDLYSAARGKKPFAKAATIELKKAGLPFIPQYPELAISPTSPILVAAAGPRPPRMGTPPPDKEVILVAWDIRDSSSQSSVPYKMNRPTQYPDLETAIPSDLVTYGSTVASIWIPATFRAMPNRRGDGYNLVSVPVPHKLILVWDLIANTTRIYRIPNTPTVCVSPDCRYVAYCDVSGGVSARGTLAVLDLSDGSEVWTWPDREAGEAASGVRRQGYEQLENLGRVTELTFSIDAKMLIVGDSDGRSGMYELRGSRSDGDRMELYAM